MQDPRALANTKNLNSYRAWQREGAMRSGLNGLVLFVALSAPAFAFVAERIEHVTKADPSALVRLMGAALALYAAAQIGLMLFGVQRLNAWKKAHPWSPPAPCAPRGL